MSAFIGSADLLRDRRGRSVREDLSGLFAGAHPTVLHAHSCLELPLWAEVGFAEEVEVAKAVDHGSGAL